jgi:hypothetical protein
LVVACGLALGVVALPDGADAQTTGFPSVGTNFAAAGPYQVATQADATNTFFFPSNLGVDGLKHPVILWGNGTFTQVTNYEALLRHFASHGFIVAAANTSNAGSGNEMLTGLNTLQTWNGQSGNRFFGKVDLTRVGSTGHSQGGGGAEATGRDSRVDTVFPAQPWLGNPPGRGTAIYFAGQSDTVVAPSTVRDDYDQSSGIPAAYAELAGASHFIPVNDGGGYRGAMTAWARWQLMGDTIARGQFVGAGCGLCTSSAWSAYSANALLAGSGGPTTTGPGPTTTRPQPTTTTTAPWWCFWCGWFG